MLDGIGCGGNSSEAPRDPVANRSQADFVNGGFETGDLSSWTVVVGQNPNNTGIPIFPPQSVTDLGIVGGVGTNLTFARMGATPESQIPSGLSAAESLRYPRFGSYSTVVNESGNNHNANSISQTLTTTQADVDALDGKIHVRFALAPVLQNPNPPHTQEQQPYFFVELRNMTKSRQIFSSFNFSNQPGVPWKSNATNSVQYTDWQLFDVAPGPTGIAIGDQLRMTVVAAGCAFTAHFGEIYIDGFGTYLPGLTIVGSGPQAANSNTDITYTFVAKNGSSGPIDNVVINEVLPPNTTFVASNGATCTTPAVGAAGTVSCNIGTLNPGAGATFTVTVHIAPGTTGTINNGNYTIQGTGVNPLLGPLVQTAVTTGVTYTDLAVTVNDGMAALDWGSPTTYTVVATNNGPSAVTGAQLMNSLPAELTGVTWTCTGANGGVCGAATGNGALNTMADLPVGASVTYTVMGTVMAGSGTGILNYLVTLNTPAGVSDNNTNNNSAVDTNNIGPVRALTIDKSQSNGSGTIVSAPASIRCGEGCTMATGNFADGSMVTLTAVAGPGSDFAGWGGACAAAGTAPQCTVTMDQAKTATANFQLRTYPITINIPGGHGTITCDNPALHGRDANCMINPEPGYAISSVVIDGVEYRATVDNNRFIIPNVTGPHVIDGEFRKGPGGSCGDRSECASGFFCVGGLCCNTPCNGACESCANPGTEGTCSSACGAFACDSAANACFNACTTNEQCVAGGLCADGACLPPAPGQYQLSGGGIAACSYNTGSSDTSKTTSAELALLAMVGFLFFRRRQRATA